MSGRSTSRGHRPEIGPPASGPIPLAAALSELVALRGLARPQGDAQLASIWKEVAGDRIASRTKVLGVNRGVLQVGVSNSALLSELAAFHKASLLKTLAERHAHLRIRDLKFRLRGDLSGFRTRDSEFGHPNPGHPSPES